MNLTDFVRNYVSLDCILPYIVMKFRMFTEAQNYIRSVFVLCISAYETPSAVPPMQLINQERVASTSLRRGIV